MTDPERTHAVVIGIDTYKTLAEISGPALDAAKFASWLTDHGVPAGQVTCLLSPSSATAGEVSRLVGRFEPAGRDAVTRMFEQTFKRCAGDMLIVYWAGHGIERDGQLMLYFADYDTVALGLNDLMDRLRDQSVPFDRQALFVDACRLPADWLNMRPPDPHFFPRNERTAPDRKQSALNAVPWGHVSALLDHEQTSVFGKALREELGLSGEPWPPDPKAIGEAIARRKDVTAPISVVYSGSGGERTQWEVGAPPQLSGMERIWRSGLIRQLEKLAGGSGELPTLARQLATHYRDYASAPAATAAELVERFGGRPGAPAVLRELILKYPHPPASLPAAQELVEFLSGVVEYQDLTSRVLNELHSLWTRHHLPTPGREGLYAAYRRTAYVVTDPRPLGTIHDYAKHLLDSPGGPQLLFGFLERVARLLDHQGSAEPDTGAWREGARKLRDWCDKRVADSRGNAVAKVSDLTRNGLHELRAAISREPLSTRRHILVRSVPGDVGRDVRVWEYWDSTPSGGQPPEDLVAIGHPLPAPEGSDTDERTVAAILSRRNIRLAADNAKDAKDRVIVEVMLPPSELPVTKVEDWNLHEDAKVGTLVPVVVRPLRDLGVGVSPAAFDRWAAMYGDSPATEYLATSQGDGGYRDKSVACLAVNFTHSDNELVKLLDDARACGMPAVIWSRNGSGVTSLVQSLDVGGLPDRVLAARRRQPDPAEVVLVWDNPHWVPDQDGSLEWSGKPATNGETRA